MAAKSSRDIVCTTAVKVESTTVLKLVYTMNSTLGDIMANPIGAQFMAQMMTQSAASAAGESGDALGMGAGLMEMMNGMPLRSLIAFGGGMVPTEIIEGLLAQLNA